MNGRLRCAVAAGFALLVVSIGCTGSDRIKPDLFGIDLLVKPDSGMPDTGATQDQAGQRDRGTAADRGANDLAVARDASADSAVRDAAVVRDAAPASDAAGLATNHPDAVGTGVRKTIVIDGLNTNDEWGSDTLLIRDPAGDDARFLGTNWSAHEAPWDYAALHAAWDDHYLYIGIQYVNVTDAIDGANLGSSEGSQIQGMDLVQSVVFDVDPTTGYSTGGDMWGKAKQFGGSNKPDFQLYFHSNFSQEGTYFGAWNGTALVQTVDGLQDPNLTGKGGEFYVGSTLPGVVPNSDDGTPGVYTQTVDFLSPAGVTGTHSTQYDTFFELKIPLALLGLGAKTLDNKAIGIFAMNGDLSSVDSIPDDNATKDTLGVSSSNSPEEWGDTDTFSAPFVLVGKAP